jgi:hypothetical protein
LEFQGLTTAETDAVKVSRRVMLTFEISITTDSDEGVLSSVISGVHASARMQKADRTSHCYVVFIIVIIYLNTPISLFLPV